MAEEPYKRSQLRLPHELHDRVTKAAADTGRSMNAEIVARLEATFDDPRQPYSRAYAEVASLTEVMNYRLLQWNHILLRKHDVERRIVQFRARAVDGASTWKKRAEEAEKELQSLEDQLHAIEKQIDETQRKRELLIDANPKEFGPIT